MDARSNKVKEKFICYQFELNIDVLTETPFVIRVNGVFSRIVSKVLSKLKLVTESSSFMQIQMFQSVTDGCFSGVSIEWLGLCCSCMSDDEYDTSLAYSRYFTLKPNAAQLE